MKRHFLFIGATLLAAAFLMGTAPKQANDGKAKKEQLTWQTFEQGWTKAQKEKKLMVVDFYTDWCGWCKVMDRDTYGNEGVIKFAKEKLVLVKVNAESNEKTRFRGQELTYRELARGFGVTGYPATAFIDSGGVIITFADGNGKTYNVLPGYRSAEDFLPIIEYFGERHHTKMSFEAFLEKRKKG
jgi:thioredoxin-related protein